MYGSDDVISAEADRGPAIREGAEGFVKESKMWRAVLTDCQFWIPVVVLILGIALLVYLR